MKLSNANIVLNSKESSIDDKDEEVIDSSSYGCGCPNYGSGCKCGCCNNEDSNLV